MKKSNFLQAMPLKPVVAKLFGIILCFVLTYETAFAQDPCDFFFVSHVVNDCDDAGTPNDPSDDTFTVIASISHPWNPNGAWTSNDVTNPGENYNGIDLFNFGPYLMSGGDVTITIQDDMFGCPTTETFKAPEPCTPPNTDCIDATITATLMEMDGDPCTYDYQIEIVATEDVEAFFAISNLLVTGGQIVNSNTSNPFVSVDQNQNRIRLIAGAGSGYHVNQQLLVNVFVTAGPGDCIEIVPSGSNFYFLNTGGPLLNCPFSFDLPAPECVASETVCGVIQNAFLNCDDTQDGGIENATVTVTDECGNETEGVTDEHGQYCVEVVPGSCVKPVVNPDDCPKCETYLTQHDCLLLDELILVILGLPHSLSPAQILAGDTDGDGIITAVDLLTIRKACLGIEENHDMGQCHYVPVSNLHPDKDDDKYIEYEAECGEMDFVMVIVGDLNGNCSGCDTADDGPVNDGPTLDALTMQSNTLGSSWTSVDDLAVRGLLLSFEVDPSVKESDIRVNPNLWNADEFILEVKAGYLFVGLESEKGIQLQKGEELIQVNTESPVRLMEESWVNGFAVQTTAMKRLNSVEQVTALNITPNPFSAAFQIQLNLEKEEVYELAIYDLQGKRVLDQNGRLVKGNNAIDVRELNLVPAGTYIVQLVTASNTYSSKLVKY